MNIIKVDAIGSTNTFLKDLCQSNTVENFTVVITENQLKGRGQVAAFWESEPTKNLTFSILIQHDGLLLKDQFEMNKVISLAIYDVLSNYLTVRLSVKWPNDIMAERKKICGILVENSVRKAHITQSIVGVGLNVNQELFLKAPNATSMKLISGITFNSEAILIEVVKAIKTRLVFLSNTSKAKLNEEYLSVLYRFNTPQMFKSSDKIFIGKIVGVSELGMLQVELDDSTIKEFGLKEIQLLNQ